MLDWVNLYQRLPYMMRKFFASARGLYLRSWRYGLETDLLAEEVLSREKWNNDQWAGWQEKRLAYLLERAVKKVPYYRSQWKNRRRNGYQTSWNVLGNWPILEKETLRQNSEDFLAEDCNIRRMYHEHTSGTTGKSLDLWWSRDTVRNWYALFESRWRIWYGVTRHDRWAILGGQLVASGKQNKPPFWVWNAGLNQLYLSSYHLSPSFIPYYLDAIKRYRIKYLWGYTSSLYALAVEALRLGRKDIRMHVAITNAEPVFDYQREAIREAFQCPVRETYGMAEIVTAASECEAGNLHLWPEVGIVEVIVNGHPAKPGEVGDLVCTGLLNLDMPLIRYPVGDRAALCPDDDPCPCGRTLPRIARLEGRSDDMLYTSDGRRIGRLDPVFKTQLPVVEAQIIQEALDQVRVRYVPAPDFAEKDSQSITKRIQDRMGPVKVVLERVEVIPREPNGKFRAVISALSPEDIRKISLISN